MPRTITKTLKITFEWQDAEPEVGQLAGYVLTDIVDTDTNKDAPDLSLATMQELTEKLTP